jgi:hypothetical protein
MAFPLNLISGQNPGWVFLIVLFISWFITPGLPWLIGYVFESRAMSLNPKHQFMAFFPGDLLLGLTSAGLAAYATNVTSAGWYTSVPWAAVVLVGSTWRKCFEALPVAGLSFADKGLSRLCRVCWLRLRTRRDVRDCPIRGVELVADSGGRPCHGVGTVASCRLQESVPQGTVRPHCQLAATLATIAFMIRETAS